MRIDELRVLNYRRFVDRTLTFADPFTLLIGANGAGKTAVVDALAIALGAALVEVPAAPTRPIHRQEVRRTYRRAGETVDLIEHNPTRVTAWGSVDGCQIEWSRELKSTKLRTTRQHARPIRRAMADLVRRCTENDDTVLPCIGYYGTGRLWVEQRLAAGGLNPDKPKPRYAGYRNCLTPTSSTRHLVAWVKRLELVQAQRRRPLETLRAAYEAIVGCVDDAVDASFDFAEDDIVIEFLDGSRYPFYLLSDGQRRMAGTAADIAMRCAQLNPHLNGQALTETPGVVLIDEIDLHLHPRWQRRVVEDLCRTFPRMQFIATTQSPFIIQSIQRDATVDLDREENGFISFEERSIEDISEELMGVDQPQRSRRFRAMVEAAEQYYRAIEDAGTESDAKHVDILRAKLDFLEESFADNPAYVAFLRLRRLSESL